MQNPPVLWSEGMFLRPHHFQASDRHWAENAALHQRLDHAYGYGLAGIQISEDALAAKQLEVRGLTARLRDGTIISSGDDFVQNVKLDTRLAMAQAKEAITVYLAIPQTADGQANVDFDPQSHCRFIGGKRQVLDEHAGGNRQEVEVRRLNYRLMFSGEDLSGFDLLPIARLQATGNNASPFRVDGDYYPPSLSVNAWPPLAAMLSDLRNFLGGRIQTMAAIVRDRGISLGSQVEGDLQKVLLLHVLNESYAELTCLLHAAGVHPLTVYERLCAIYGRCLIFETAPISSEMPQYDHDDLARIYRWVCDEIRRLVNSVKEDECVQRYFIGSGRGLHVNLEPEWFNPEWAWFFGVNPINFSVEECIELLRGGIDWKLGSTDKVEQYMTLRQPGLKLRSVKQLPRVLSGRRNWVFFQIRLDDEPWKQVQLSQTMAMRVRAEQISNIDSLEGQRRLHITVGPQTFGMEFAVFAVKQRL